MDKELLERLGVNEWWIKNCRATTHSETRRIFEALAWCLENPNAPVSNEIVTVPPDEYTKRLRINIDDARALLALVLR